MSVLAFPEAPRITARRAAYSATTEELRAQNLAYLRSLPMPVPAPIVVTEMSSWWRLRVLRALQDDQHLTAAAVLVGVCIVQNWSEKRGGSVPSPATLCDAARLHIGPDRRIDIPGLNRAVAELVARGWVTHEPFEYKAGTGFPGRRFILTADIGQER